MRNLAQGELRAFQGAAEPSWGIAVQLYAVRSAANWGIGDFTDLRSILETAARCGASAVGLNPLHALFLDRPESASPYAPNSRLFLNPLYIDVTAIPEFEGIQDAALGEAVDALRASELVDYAGVAALKERTLRAVYARFLERATPDRTSRFEHFRAEQGEKLTRFSCFEVLRRRFDRASWRQWPDPWKSPDLPTLDELRRRQDRECGFFEFLQWVADDQLGACQARAGELGLPIGLYLDLAVGVDPEGADAWSNQSAVLGDFSVGAPPDEFNPAGQDWGLAPFNPHALPDNDFAAFRELLAAAMRHAGAVRLDHVLGLMRLYLVPHGSSASMGAYVRFPFEPLLRVIAEESNKYRCIFIGEDLGTVPEGFRETAGRWGVWTYRVMMFERWGDGEFKKPHDYPHEALATFNTHDLPTFRGWVSGHDLGVKRALGLDSGEDDDSRQRAREALGRALSGDATGSDSHSLPAACAYLAATPAKLVMVSVEDMLDVVEQVNIPGTIDQHPNWRRKLPVALESWTDGDTWKNVASALERAGRGLRR
jgi:4-alpha-glucanotransferase